MIIPNQDYLEELGFDSLDDYIHDYLMWMEFYKEHLESK